MTLNPNASLAQAQAYLRTKVDKGERCPCCNQMAKVYRRKVTSGHARALITMYREAHLEWFYLPAIQKQWQSRDESTMRYFDLIEEATTPRPDGGRAGWWRVTPLGQKFILGHTTIPKYARIYDGRCLGLDPVERASIKDALGTKFSYDELMRGV